MVDPSSIGKIAVPVAEGALSAFAEATVKAIIEKWAKGNKLTELETFMLVTDERFKSAQSEMRSRFASVDGELRSLRDKIDAIEERLDFARDIAQIKLEIAQLKARTA
jgi:hypothetical protein